MSNSFINRRYRSKAMWSSLIAQILIAIQILCKILGWDFTDELHQDLLLLFNALLLALAIAGVLNDPTTENKGFKDDK